MLRDSMNWKATWSGCAIVRYLESLECKTCKQVIPQGCYGMILLDCEVKIADKEPSLERLEVMSRARHIECYYCGIKSGDGTILDDSCFDLGQELHHYQCDKEALCYSWHLTSNVVTDVQK